MPAIYNLQRDGQLPSNFICCGFARREKTHDQFRAEMKEAVNSYSRSKPIDDSVWNSFKEHLFYHQSEFHDDEGYQRFKTFMNTLDVQYGTKGNRIYYLSTQPSFFATIIEHLKKNDLLYDHEKIKNNVVAFSFESP